MKFLEQVFQALGIGHKFKVKEVESSIYHTLNVLKHLYGLLHFTDSFKTFLSKVDSQEGDQQNLLDEVEEIEKNYYFEKLFGEMIFDQREIRALLLEKQRAFF